jgi:hypothetical protein
MPKPLKQVNKGDIFGRLTVVKELPFRYVNAKTRLRHFRFKCTCGSIKDLDLISVTRSSEPTRSCGCLVKESTGTRFLKHGLYKHPLYKIWHGMKDRCYNKDNKSYDYYGRKGITVCKRWLKKRDFEGLKHFIQWSEANGYKRGLEIDRKDNNDRYCPENCRWVTPIENKNNCDNNVQLVHNNKTYTLAQFHRKYKPHVSLAKDSGVTDPRELPPIDFNLYLHREEVSKVDPDR